LINELFLLAHEFNPSIEDCYKFYNLFNITIKICKNSRAATLLILTKED